MWNTQKLLNMQIQSDYEYDAMEDKSSSITLRSEKQMTQLSRETTYNYKFYNQPYE